MSHHSDDAGLVATSDSFWEPGNYKRTTKRVEDGLRLCSDLIQLIQERGDIEKAYAKSMRNWSKKWNELIEKGPEYGTTEAAWKGVLVEADRQCELHIRVKDRLLNEVVAQIKQWQKDSYHRSMMQLKEKKEMDDAFKKAQKPWAKLLAKVNKCKLDYHTACKNEKTSINQERNAAGDTSLSPDQIKKLQDRVAKSKDDVQKTRERYQQAIREINDTNAKYMEDMTVVFDKCQEFEEKRLEFFKEALFSIHDCLNISTDPELPQIYEEYRHTIQNADAIKDLKWWSNNHGVGMAMNWPQYEEYSEEFRDIIGKSKKGTFPETGIMLINQQRINDDLPECPVEVQNTSRKEKKGLDSGMSIHSQDSTKSNKDKDKVSSLNSNGEQNHGSYDDDEWDECPNDALVDNGEVGVPVRALYDYVGAESDELSFKQGEMFEKLEEEDDQGWCKGRKDGKVGLYPANYVQPIQN